MSSLQEIAKWKILGRRASRSMTSSLTNLSVWISSRRESRAVRSHCIRRRAQFLSCPSVWCSSSPLLVNRF
jgi:hypothetical protein